MKATKKITYQENSDEYVIKLKKKSYWWLLLFLLLFLPLILLIQLHKDIRFKIVNNVNKAPIAKAEVTFSYHAREFFDFESKSFFSKKTETRKGKTDENGVVAFDNVAYSLYSRIFCSDEVAKVNAISECFLGDSVAPKFHEIKDKAETILELPVRTYDLTFQVVDKDDNQPLPGAQVKAESQILGIKNNWNDSTNVNGIAELKKIPYCSEIVVVGSCYGYINDTLKDLTKNLVGKPDSLRRLKLKPLKKMVTFNVKNLKTKEPLPGATATLKIKNKTVTIRTNTNGVGKGVFDEVHVIAEMTLLVQKSFFYDTLKNDRVDNFTSKNDEYRTIYLRPRMQDISFRNIDMATKAPISGVKNIITVNGTKRPEEVYSNGEGKFSVAGVFGEDKISVHASKSGYEDNNTTIVNRLFSELLNGSQDKRDIPMKMIPPPPPPPPPKRDDGFQGESGDLRINLQWSTTDDLDLYVTDPCGNKIWYRSRKKSCGSGNGTLDVDANVTRLTSSPQENCFFNAPSKGAYVVQVKFFKRNNKNGGPVNFNVTIIDKGVRKDYPGVANSAGDDVLVTTHVIY